MRTKKIRGHKRRWKDVNYWVSTHNKIDLEYLKDYHRDYAKIRVHPWSEISMTESRIPEPKRKTKKKIILGLIDIYKGWKKELDTLKEPYYLKIWFCENRISNSQVVCAIGDALNFYDNSFFDPNTNRKFNPEKYGNLSSILSEFEWEHRLDEDHFESDFVGEPDEFSNYSEYLTLKKWFDKQLLKPHRVTKLNTPNEDYPQESYSFNMGNLWLASIK